MNEYQAPDILTLRDKIALKVWVDLKDTDKDIEELYADFQAYVDNSVDGAYTYADAFMRRRQQAPE